MSIISLKESPSGSIDVLQLDMAPDSVDDMYSWCKEDMKTKVEEEYLQKELNENAHFKNGWEAAEEKHKTTFARDKTGKEQIMAMYLYTVGPGNFNNAVRSQKSEYKTTFGYHALHFYLTDALQILREPNRCLTGYRGVDRSFSQDVVNQQIRFGSFTSSTLHGYKRAKTFGEKSCFKIETCFGADISLYSKFGDAEGEVLIPPYEIFKVTAVKKRSEHPNLECEVVYEVKSTKRTRSTLDCALFMK